MSGMHSMTVIEGEGNRVNVEQGGALSTKTDDVKAMWPGSKPVLMQKSLTRYLPIPITNVVHHALVQGLDLLGDVLVGEKSRNDEFEEVKEEQYRLPEEVILYKVEKETLEKTLIEKKGAMKAMIRVLVDLTKWVMRLEKRKCLLIKTNKTLLSCSSQTTSGGGRITEKMVNNIPPKIIIICVPC